jgi:L-asparaginase
MAKGKTIHVLITGGTIDSHFNPAKDSTEIGKTAYTPNCLKKLKLHNPLKFDCLFLKDSRDITPEDQILLLKAIKDSPSSMILITHGTYTMADTARCLKANLKGTGKTVVLTGSMIPLTGFGYSDAAFNLGYAIASIQTLLPGVYVCMNGRVFDPDGVDKNKSKGRFENKAMPKKE